MKIAHIVCTYPPYFGGMGNSAFHLAEHLTERGHDVTVFTPLVDSEPDIETQATVARVAPSLSYGNGGLFPTITHELDQFDLVHLHYPFFGVAGKVKRWKQKHPHIPLVTTYHMDPRGKGLIGMYMNWYARWYMPKVLQASDAIIASTFEFVQASEAGSMYIENPKAWHEIPFGVDMERFHPERAISELRYRLGAVDKPMVLFVGGMDAAHHFKGIPTLLKAFRKSLKKRDMHLVLVGDGDERSVYEAQSVFYGISDYVSFVGAVSDEDLPRYYASADVTVLPSESRAEAFGMVLLESIASGTSVIASDLPGVRAVASLAGETFPVNDVDALATLLVSSRFEPVSTDVMQQLNKTYTWEAVAKQTEQVYQSVSEEA